MVSLIGHLIVTEALRPALLPQSEEEKRSVREDGYCPDVGFVMEEENVEGDRRAWTTEIEPETSRLENSRTQYHFGRFGS